MNWLHRLFILSGNSVFSDWHLYQLFIASLTLYEVNSRTYWLPILSCHPVFVSSRLQRFFMLSHSFLFHSQEKTPAVDFTAQPSPPHPYVPHARYDCSLGTYPATSSVLETLVDHDSQTSKQPAIFNVSSICAVWLFDQPIIFVALHYFVAYFCVLLRKCP